MNIAMTNHRLFNDDHDEESNDMTPEFFILAGVSVAATYLGAGGDPWAMCIPGAIFASFIALLKTTQDKRTWAEKAANSVGISFIGSTAPAGLQYFWPDLGSKLNWQIAALLGFLLGFCGWPLAYAFVKVFGLRSDRFASDVTRKWSRKFTNDPESEAGKKADDYDR